VTRLMVREQRAWWLGRLLLITAEVITIAGVFLAGRAGFAPGLAAGLVLSAVLGWMNVRHYRRRP
jgi:hypothetical protein